MWNYLISVWISSVALAEQIQTLDKTALAKKIGSLDGTHKMAELDLAIMKQL